MHRFYEELENERLPQWSFVTPNLIHDGHNTDIATSCNWTRSFVEPLLQNTYFNDNRLVYITWQADTQHPTGRNQVAGILLGSAIPSQLVGTTDSSYYNHYSDLSTVEANWGLHHLGRWDVGANVWSFVASRTGDEIRSWNEEIAGDSFENYYWNQSYGGVFSSAQNTSHVYVAPNLELTQNGRTILPAIASVWGSASSKVKRGMKGGAKACKPKYHKTTSSGLSGTSTTSMSGQSYSTTSTSSASGTSSTSTTTTGLPDYYRNIIELPDALHPPQGFEVPIGLNPPPPITTPITIYPY